MSEIRKIVIKYPFGFYIEITSTEIKIIFLFGTFLAAIFWFQKLIMVRNATVRNILYEMSIIHNEYVVKVSTSFGIDIFVEIREMSVIF